MALRDKWYVEPKLCSSSEPGDVCLESFNQKLLGPFFAWTRIVLLCLILAAVALNLLIFKYRSLADYTLPLEMIIKLTALLIPNEV